MLVVSVRLILAVFLSLLGSVLLFFEAARFGVFSSLLRLGSVGVLVLLG